MRGFGIGRLTARDHLVQDLAVGVGLNRCPQPWWDSLDPPELAADSHADYVVLNGPRHFVVDAVVEPNPGPIASFAGKRLRRAARIDLSKTRLNRPPPYSNIAIARDNTCLTGACALSAHDLRCRTAGAMPKR